jgi:Cu+-exporting ATPase
VSVQTQRPGELWAEEPSHLEGRARIRARIAGLHCSLCTGTIEKALGRIDGVDTVAVSLTHEQALVDYDPARVRPERILSTLRDIGYELYDPRKLRPFEEEEAALVREGVRLLAAVAGSLAAIGLIARVSGVWSVLVPASVVVVMVPVAWAILRPAGRVKAVMGSLGIVAPGAAALVLRATGLLTGGLIGWLAGALALGVVLGVAPHILRMAYQSARRGILNQHVLLEIGAFAGITGGVIGLTGLLPRYPTAAFFAVSVLVANYHIFSEWLSLLVKTRSSQAVKKLLDLQPDLARVIREDGREAEVPVEQVRVGDLVRVRPGGRIPVDGRVREGFSTLDLSLVTGEPMPVERGAGDSVVAGSLNGPGTLLMQATAPASESFLAQVVRHVEDARALKPGILHLVDRILRVYTPTVLTVSALALAGWLAGSELATGHPDVRRAVFAALSVLVMVTPARSVSPRRWRSSGALGRPPTLGSSCAPGRPSRPSGRSPTCCWTRPAPSPWAGPPSSTSSPPRAWRRTSCSLSRPLPSPTPNTPWARPSPRPRASGDSQFPRSATSPPPLASASQRRSLPRPCWSADPASSPTPASTSPQ